MSALVNFTTIPPFTAASVTNIPAIPIIASPFAGFRVELDASVSASAAQSQLRHHRQKMVGRRRLERRKEGEEEEDKDKKRRSLNIPEYGKAKELRLFNTRQNTFVQIQNDGTVKTGPQSNSIHSIFEILFWCHLAPQLYKPCSSSQSSFSAILLRFKASNRYLCMSHSGKIYTQVPDDSLKNVEDCIFQHEFLSNQYDVYYSWRYPNETWPCETQPGRNVTKKTCHKRWYLGVDKKGRLCTVKSLHTKVKRNTFFIQRWIHDQVGQGRPDYPNPLAGSTPETPTVEGGIFKIHSARSRSSVFDILSHKRRNERTRLTAEEVTSTRRDCLNLLKHCEREEKSKDEKMSSASQRPPPQPEKLSTLRRRRGVLRSDKEGVP